MKKLIAITTMFLTSISSISPEAAKAQYSWQCSWQTYCGYNYYGQYTCWRREQCCEQVYNPWTGVYAWQCFWR